MITKNEIATCIGYSVLEMNQSNEVEKDYMNTNNILNSMKITDIVITNNVITIVSARPGFVIGKAGVIINKISSNIKQKFPEIQEVTVKENEWHDDLYPIYPYSGEFDFDDTDFTEDIEL